MAELSVRPKNSQSSAIDIQSGGNASGQESASEKTIISPTGPDEQSLRIRRIAIALDFGSSCTAGVYRFISGVKPSDSYDIVPFDGYKTTTMAYRSGTAFFIPSEVQYDRYEYLIGFDVKPVSMRSRTTLVRYMKLALAESEAFKAEQQEVKEQLKKASRNYTFPLSDGFEDDNSGTGHRILTPERVVEHFLTEVFAFWKRDLVKKANYQREDILSLNCAVPTAWTETLPTRKLEKAIRRASTRAKLPFEEPIRFWPEPEAAIVDLLENHDYSKFVNSGQIILVCDAGGGTVDLTAYKILSKDPLRLKEIGVSNGAPCGSHALDRNFVEHVKRRLIEAGFSGEGITLSIEEYPLTTFQNRMKPRFDDSSYRQDSFEFYGVKYNDDMDMEDGSIWLRRKHLKEIFDPVVNQVLGLIDTQLRIIWSEKLALDALFLVGGFGESPYLQESIRKHLQSKTQENLGTEIWLKQNYPSAYAVAEGCITSDWTGASIVSERVNRCSVGLRQREHNPRKIRSESDPVDSQWEEKVVVLLKKKSDGLNESIEKRFYLDVWKGDETVNVPIDFYASDTVTENHLAPSDGWQELGCEEVIVNVSGIWDQLQKPKPTQSSPQSSKKQNKRPRDKKLRKSLSGKASEQEVDHQGQPLTLQTSGSENGRSASSSTRGRVTRSMTGKRASSEQAETVSPRPQEISSSNHEAHSSTREVSSPSDEEDTLRELHYSITFKVDGLFGTWSIKFDDGAEADKSGAFSMTSLLAAGSYTS